MPNKNTLNSATAHTSGEASIQSSPPDSFYVIYKAWFSQTPQCYVGQSCNFSARKTSHRNLKKSTCRLFREAIRKYGEPYWHIICRCETQEEADRMEAFYIKLYRAMEPEYGFNIFGGRNSRECRKEVRQKQSEQKKGGKNPMFGKTHEPDALAKISAESKSRVRTDATREKLSVGKLGDKNPSYGKVVPQERRDRIASKLFKSYVDKNGRECVECGEYKEWAVFDKNCRNKTTGHLAICKECRSEMRKVNKD